MDKDDIKLGCLIFVICFLLFGLFGVAVETGLYFENRNKARRFNAAFGTNYTTWDIRAGVHLYQLSQIHKNEVQLHVNP